MISALLLASTATVPTGTYTGTKTVLGVSIDATVKVNSPSALDLDIMSGTISCPSEAYTLAGSTITMINMDKPGDCVHDALASEPGLTFQSITYDPSADTITVEAKETIVAVKFVLKKPTPGLFGATLNIETAQERDAMFEAFVRAHGRTYTSVEERAARRAIFEENLDLITARNRDGELGTHWPNKFSDIAEEEFRATHMGYVPKRNTTGIVELDLPLTASADAASIDWRTKSPKVLTPVKDQGRCGSCWAFSATEQIETDVAMATGHLYTLSPQQIVSCDKTDLGCNGGNTETAYDYVSSKGLEPESAYPYTSGNTGRDGTCRYSSSRTEVSISSYKTVSKKKSSEGKMLTQIQKSPISVCVDASKWQTYRRGILGRTCGTSLDHCVQAVGYNSAKNYWIVRNSWNTDWGQDGYIYVKEGMDACGIAKDATIVTGASATTVEA